MSSASPPEPTADPLGAAHDEHEEGQIEDLPPSAQFGTLDELYIFLQQWGIHNGMAFVKQAASNYRKIDGQPTATYVRLGCDRGSRRVSESRGIRRQGNSRLIGCPFRVRASCQRRLGDKWVYAVVNGHHNHGPSLDPVAHPVHRRRTAAQREAIRQISAIQGVPVSAIPDLLRLQFPDALITMKDIDNERQLARREALAQGTDS